MCCLRYEIGKIDYHRTTSMTFTLLVYQTSVVKALRSYKLRNADRIVRRLRRELTLLVLP